ncbi:MAG: class II aldolase/adducin family protein, partial [Candidatus Poseidoniaceae archaeon]
PPPLAVDAEVRRLRGALSTAQATIEALEEPPVPPAVLDDIVVPQHVVADFARMGRWLVHEDLGRATMGGMAMLHPDVQGAVVSTRMLTMMPRIDERSLVAGRLGMGAPRGAREDWRLLEVLLASVSMATGGPAAVIHAHGPYTTAMSCEKDLIVLQPIDAIGKKHIGRIIIVEPDAEDEDAFLRQAVEALQQGGMRCVVVRGHGAYAVGADLTQAWSNASMVEHSMRVAMLARQANLKT